MNVVEAWWPWACKDGSKKCTFYYAIINNEAWFVPFAGNKNDLVRCTEKQRGFEHTEITVDVLRTAVQGTLPYYGKFTKGYLNLDTGEFHAS